MDYTFETNALEEFAEWAIYDKKVFKKIMTLLRDIKREPYSGLGKPEALKFGKSGYWSRRITQEHRLVYRVIKEETILIASCKGHY